MSKRTQILATAWWADVLPGVMAGGVCLVLYLRTLAPGVLGGDAGEMQFVPYILSLAHPMGYPLHTLLGKVWATVVPFGSVAYRMNLLSAVAGAAAVGLVYGTVRILTGSRLGALAAALLLGVSQLFWEQSLSADKYSLTNLMLSLVLLALARWSAAPGKRDLAWCAFLYGLSLTQHRTMLVFLPLLVGYWVWRDRRLLRDRRYGARTGLLVLAPLALFLWLPIGAARHLPPGSWPIESLRDWLNHLLDRGHLAQMHPLANLGPDLAFYGRTLLEQFGPYGVALALAGAIRQARMRQPLGAFIALGFALQVVLSVSNDVPRHWVYFLPSFVLFALWIGEGMAWLWRAVLAGVQRSKPLGYGLAGLVALSLCPLIGLPLQSNYPALREAHLDGGTLDLWRQNLKSGYLAQRLVTDSMQAADPGGIIVCDWEQAAALWYWQQVEGGRPDISVFYPIERWPEALATGRPVYLARTLPGVGEPYHLTSAGPLVRVSTGWDGQVPDGATPAAIHWEDQIELAGYRYHQTDLAMGYVLPASLYFRATQPLSADYSLSLRLYAEDGSQVWAEDRQHPVLGMYPTTRWLPGEVVGDYFEVPFPRAVPAGRYRLGIVVYASLEGGGWQNLTVAETGDEVAYLPPFEVPPRR
jgi:hypothetical protein